MKYEHTHVSVNDGSPAMLIENRGMRLLLMNEDGHEWEDHASEWEPIEQPTVSAQKLLTINLLHDESNDTWFSANLGWVTDITLASVVSERVHELLLEVSPNPDNWRLVKFVQIPF